LISITHEPCPGAFCAIDVKRTSIRPKKKSGIALASRSMVSVRAGVASVVASSKIEPLQWLPPKTSCTVYPGAGT
jgi:hypothetical protein